LTYLVFDIETRIDKSLVRQVFFRGEELDDEEAYRRMREELREQDGRDFFPLSCHLPVSIALGEVDDQLRLVSLASLAGGEREIVTAFWRRLEALEGTLVSFNGRGFDLPVLELAALRFDLSLPKYFNEPRRFRARSADAHFDLYDFFSNAGAYRLRGGFDLLAKLAGLPGKAAMSGGRVQEEWEAGNLEAVHSYCRDDVLQTYLLFLRVELIRGRIDAAQCAQLRLAAERLR